MNTFSRDCRVAFAVLGACWRWLTLYLRVIMGSSINSTKPLCRAYAQRVSNAARGLCFQALLHSSLVCGRRKLPESTDREVSLHEARLSQGEGMHHSRRDFCSASHVHRQVCVVGGHCLSIAQQQRACNDRPTTKIFRW